MGTAAIQLDGQEMISDPRNPTPGHGRLGVLLRFTGGCCQDGGNLKATALETTYGSIGGSHGLDTESQ